ncbi:MAG: hypothetical protein C0443_01500 [Comamonadaceae bacterium]|nr:hypothetical protein [Comamonadaceae bacterium]
MSATDGEGHHDSPLQTNERSTPLWRRPLTLAWAAVVVMAVFYLLREHWGHVLGWCILKRRR